MSHDRPDKSPLREWLSLHNDLVTFGPWIGGAVTWALWFFAGLPGPIATGLGGIFLGIFLVVTSIKVFESNNDPLLKLDIGDALSDTPSEREVNAREVESSAQSPVARPNFVCTETYLVEFIDQNGILVERQRGSHGNKNIKRSGVALVAEIYNAFDEKLNVSKVSAVSAQITYEPPAGPPINVPRGSWLNEGAYKKGFDVNGHQELIIAAYGQGESPVTFILVREYRRGATIVGRSSFILKGNHRVKVRLISESENVVYKELNFILKITREPQVYMELERID